MNFIQKAQVFTFFLFNIISLYAQRPEPVILDGKLVAPIGHFRSQGCPLAEAGTFKINRNASNQSPSIKYLCYGDELNIIHNRNANFSGDPKPATTPGIGYVFYDCKPTVDGPNLSTVVSDPCLNRTSPIIINGSPVNQTQSMWLAKGNAIGDIVFMNDGYLQNAYNNGKPIQFWFAPITLDQFSTDNSPQFEVDANNVPGPCIDINTDSAFSVVYLNEVVISNMNGINGGTGNYSGTLTITGGLPEFDSTTNYPMVHIENIFDPNKIGRLTNAPALHGKPMTFTVPEPGRYQITVHDGTGCTHSQRYVVTIAADSGLVKLNCMDAKVGDVVCIPISISKMKELAAAQFTFLFNPQTFEYVRAQNLSPILASDTSQTVFDNDKSRGIIKFLWFDLNLLPRDFSAESVLVEFCFKVKGPPGSYEFRMTGSPVTLEFADIGGNPYPIGEGNGSILKCNSMVAPGSNLDAYYSQCGQTMFVNIFGGKGPFSVKWDQEGNPANTVIIGITQNGVPDTLMSNQPPGRYFLSITDSTGSNIKDTITLVGGLANLGVNLTTTEPSSCKNNDGRIIIAATGGTKDYRYLWSNGSVSERLTQLSTGTYFLTVTDAQGCIKTDSVIIGQSIATAAILIEAVPTCSGVSNGLLRPDFSNISGIPPITSVWQGDGVQIGNAYRNVGTNLTRLIVTDFKGCSDTAFVTLIPSKRIEVLPSSVIDNPTCFGRNDGRLSIGRQFSDGSPMVNDTVFVQNPLGIPFAGNNARPARFNNIVSGVYTVRITDQSGCFLDTALTLVQPMLLDTASVVVKPETCFPGKDASITIKMRGGTAPYRYMWNDTPLNTDTRTGLSNGNYLVTISDANNCTANFNASNLLAFSFNLPTIPVSIDTTAILCNGLGATLTARPAPGYKIASYKWSNGDTLVTARNVLANIPSWVEVTDTLGCKGSDTVILSQPLAISIADSQLIDPACPGDRFFGRISYTARGGIGPYTYTLVGGPTQNFGIFPNLIAGTYSVSITDANNCPSLILSATLREPPKIVAAFDTVAFRDTKCATPGDCSGQARLLVSGGTDPSNRFLIRWQSGEQTSNNVVSIADSLCAGLQTVQIIDGNGCSTTESFTISSPDSIARDLVRTAVQDITCFNQSNGSINYIAYGGTTPFTYLWNDNNTQNNRSGLAAGKYTLTVTDLNNCVFIDSLRITEPPELLVSLDSLKTRPITCPGTNDGQLGLQTSGGNAGDLAYSWSVAFGDTNFVRNVIPGNYQVVVIDSKGCRDTLSNIVVSEPPRLSLLINPIYNPVCAGDTIGIAITGVSGGNGASYSFSINNGNSIPIASRIGLKAGKYQLTIFDRKGCALDTAFQVIDPQKFTVDFGPDKTIRLGDSLRVVTISNSPISRISWKNIEGIDCISPDCSVISLHPTKNTVFQATAYDASGCTAFDQIAIAVDLKRAVFIPNAFRPDQLSANQEFKFFAGSGVVAIHSGRIFNRWGDLMSEVQNLGPDPGGVVIWDGRFKGTEAESGVYVYAIDVEFTDGARLLYKGDVTLIR